MRRGAVAVLMNRIVRAGCANMTQCQKPWRLAGTVFCELLEKWRKRRKDRNFLSCV